MNSLLTARSMGARLAAAMALLAFLSTVAMAQDFRSQRTFYIAPTFGISNYYGDLDLTPLDLDDWRVAGLPLSGALEMGYQLTTRFAIGGEYRIANYPTVDAPDAYTQRHTASLVMRYTPMASETRLVPYVQGGLHGTVGKTDFRSNGSNRDLFAMGPWLGVGVDYAVYPSMSVFFGINTRLSVPDHGVDGFDPSVDERTRFDLLSDAGFGLRYRFKSASGL
ncbi:MAG TPA: outer membrane beta-barrel protein [Rhodothermales bacterium]